MTNEELDDAVAVEALRICEERPTGLKFRELAQTAARLARESWTPPEPVDPDVLAFRAWASKEWPLALEAALRGHMDTTPYANAYLAGARIAREQEQERAKVLVEYVEAHAKGVNITMIPAAQALAAYKAGRAAR
jgi:hypothetical protein